MRSQEQSDSEILDILNGEKTREALTNFIGIIAEMKEAKKGISTKYLKFLLEQSQSRTIGKPSKKQVTDKIAKLVFLLKPLGLKIKEHNYYYGEQHGHGRVIRKEVLNCLSLK